MEVDIKLGGYYVFQDPDGTYGAFRLLDFGPEAYHCQPYAGHQETAPTMESLMASAPIGLHAPIDTGSLSRYASLSLVGHKALTAADLAGYETYLLHEGGVPQEVDEYLRRTVWLSEKAATTTIEVTEQGVKVK